MGPLDALNHLVNLFMPAFGMGVIGATLAKLCWRRELAAVRWRRLALSAGAACAAIVPVSLAVFGRDGTMFGYAAMVVASALALWWAGFLSR